MSKKKKKHYQDSQPASAVPSSNSPLPSPESFSRQLNFDAMEDRIRGEEMIQEQENKKLKEAQDVKKKLESIEVDRRLEALRKQLGIKK